ncbi:WD40-repeat-containing domain protein [Choanephora cucurbitarum]|nr:WD40-repeat-containing domain protein [Choanephora cucurbitarum]
MNNDAFEMPASMAYWTSKEKADRLSPYLRYDIISQLPYEIALHIFSLLDGQSLAQASQVSKYWKRLGSEQLLWKNLFEIHGWKIDHDEIQTFLHTHSPVPIQRNPIRQPQQQKSMDWKTLYKNRLELQKRWLSGSCKIEIFPPESDQMHSQGIYSLQFDKHTLVTGSRDRSIKLWDLATGHCRLQLNGHEGSVLCLQYDGQQVISGSSDATVIIFDLQTGQPKQILRGHQDSVLGVRIVRENFILSCSKDRTLRLWHRETGELVRIFQGHRAAVNAVQWKEDRIVSASGDRTVKIWNLDTGECLNTLTGHTRGVACVECDEKHIVTGSSDQTIKVWDAITGECIYTLFGHTELVRTIQFDSTASLIISGCYNGQLKIWSLTEGRLIRDLGQATDGRILNLKFDCARIMCCSNSTQVVIYNFAHGIDTRFLL